MPMTLNLVGNKTAEIVPTMTQMWQDFTCHQDEAFEDGFINLNLSLKQWF